ncbi:DUF2306 domain-containing protein [Marinobacter halodurans]|uniref:DUF2306 domain-containing protein n=1 Tax=Marinobacter halodurans TaxID=2528979 RepID=A0ABY1ZJF6_9GAMM|nr:DUF2306 domain-containing protein [Marinobacter halodurans]TBW49502.1 DUF2306 domain-containing protein [Marinobacter halodurans]
MTVSVLMNAPPAIQLHVAAACLALVLGIAQLAGTRGTLWHRSVGMAWVLAMFVVAVSSFFIHQIRLLGPWSPIHLLSLLTLFGLCGALYSLRKKRYRQHGRIMVSLFVFGLIGAGLFTLVPGRLLHAVFFG